MLEVNTALASCHFQNDGVVQPSLDFRRSLLIEFLDNKIGVYLGENRKPKRISKLLIYAHCDKCFYHGKMCDTSKKKTETKIKNQNCHNYLKCYKIPGYIVSVPRVYSFDLGAFQIINLRGKMFFS